MPFVGDAKHAAQLVQVQAHAVVHAGLGGHRVEYVLIPWPGIEGDRRVWRDTQQYRALKDEAQIGRVHISDDSIQFAQNVCFGRSPFFLVNHADQL